MSSGRLNNQEVERIAEKEERRFLSLLLKEKGCLTDAVESGIKPGKDGHFWFSDHRWLYSFIHKHYKAHGSLLTRSSMESLLVTQDSIQEEDCSAGMGMWDTTWSNNEASKEDYPFLKKSLDARYRQWQMVDILQDKLPSLIKACGNQEDLVDDIQTDINGISCLAEDNYSLVMDATEGMDKSIEHITKMRDNPEAFRGIMCGIRGIDEMYYGFVRGSYTIVSGMVNGGKSTLMFNMGWNMAKAGYRVIYVSIEKEAVPIFERVLSLHTMIDYNRIKIGGKGTAGISDYYYQKYIDGAKDVKDKIGNNFIVFQETQGVKLAKILGKADRIHSRNPVDVMIVDYLGVIGLEERFQGRPDLDLAAVSLKLQSWGKSNRIAVVTGMQFNNSATKEIRKRVAKMSSDADNSGVSMNSEDIGGAQKVIADCENCIGVALNEDDPKTKMICHVIKARDNENHKTVVLDFDGRIGRVGDPELAPGQIRAVDDLIYNEEITEDQLLSDDGLFSETPEAPIAPETKVTKEVEKTVEKSKEKDALADIDLGDADLDFLDSIEPPKPPVKQPKGLSDEERATDGNMKDNLDDFLG